MFKIDIDEVRSSDSSRSIKIQYDDMNYGLYALYAISDKSPFDKFYDLCHKVNSIQRNFFIEPFDSEDEYEKLFVFCPGYDLSYFYFPNEKDDKNGYNPTEDINKYSYYKSLTNQDKMYIMKWVFSISCAVEILLKNNFEIINIFHNSFFIDSKMEARFAYTNWETDNSSVTTFKPSQYFIAPESLHFINLEVNQTNIEKECAYSLGVLMISLLNRMMPNKYFPDYSTADIFSGLKSGEVLKKSVPDCKWSNLIKNCINVDPEKRPTIKSIIQQLIQEENCLDKDLYNEFKKFVASKFNCNNEIDLKKLFEEKIVPNLSKVSENEKCSLKPSKVKISDLQKFIDLSKDTSFEQKINEKLQILLKSLYDKLLSPKLRPIFDNCKSEKDPYKSMYSLIRYNTIDYEEKNESDYESEVNEVKEKNESDYKSEVNEVQKDENNFDNNNLDLSLKKIIEEDNLNLKHLDNMNDNFTFYTRIYKNNGKIYFVFPKELKLPDDYFDHYNNNQFFAHIENKLKREIVFYPFLNIYNILYVNASKYNFKFQEKIKWLYQTAEALSILHEKRYTVKYFNSTNIFIDINLNAHFFPSQMIKIQSQNHFENNFLDKSDFIISYLSPEIISGDFNISDPEKQVVYSFGIFILELIYNFRPDQFLTNLSRSEKINFLIKKKTFIKEDDLLHQIVQSCLEQNAEKRKSFKELAYDLKIFLNGNNENNCTDDVNSFYFQDLGKAAIKGATIPDILFDYIYKTFNFDKQLTFNHYGIKFSDYVNKFKLIWAIFAKENIKSDDFHKQSNNQKIRKKKINYATYQNSNVINKNQFNSFKDYTKNHLDKFNKTMKKVNNKSKLIPLNLGGFRIKSARNLILRYQYNVDDKYHQQTEFTVKNFHFYPYGDDLKMSHVEDIINDMRKEKMLKKNTVVSKLKNGDIKLESQVS